MPVTRNAAARAVWKIVDGQAHIMFVDDSASAEPARRWPDVPLPSCAPGHLAFDSQDYPSLTRARALAPGYALLWDAVARELAVRRGVAGPAARTHNAFFGLPLTEQAPTHG